MAALRPPRELAHAGRALVGDEEHPDALQAVVVDVVVLPAGPQRPLLAQDGRHHAAEDQRVLVVGEEAHGLVGLPQRLGVVARHGGVLHELRPGAAVAQRLVGQVAQEGRPQCQARLAPAQRVGRRAFAVQAGRRPHGAAQVVVRAVHRHAPVARVQHLHALQDAVGAVEVAAVGGVHGGEDHVLRRELGVGAEDAPPQGQRALHVGLREAVAHLGQLGHGRRVGGIQAQGHLERVARREEPVGHVGLEAPALEVRDAELVEVVVVAQLAHVVAQRLGPVQRVLGVRDARRAHAVGEAFRAARPQLLPLAVVDEAQVGERLHQPLVGLGVELVHAGGLAEPLAGEGVADALPLELPRGICPCRAQPVVARRHQAVGDEVAQHEHVGEHAPQQHQAARDEHHHGGGAGRGAGDGGRRDGGFLRRGGGAGHPRRGPQGQRHHGGHGQRRDVEGEIHQPVERHRHQRKREGQPLGALVSGRQRAPRP